MDENQKREEFARVWLNAEPSVSAYVFASITVFHDAEDVIQQVAQTLARRFDEYDADRPFVGWALWIAKSRVIDFYRAKRRSQLIFFDALLTRLADTIAEQSEGGSRRREALEACLDELPEKSRRPLDRRYVEAPARFNAVIGQRLVLHSGRLTANVPAEGIGFTVETPEAKVVDFGTEFSVDVASGTSEVHLFDGLVRVQPRSRKGGVTAEGESLRIYENGQLVASAPCSMMATSDLTPLWFGTAGGDYALWDGRIDEVTLFDKTVGENDIANLYQSALVEMARAK